MTAPTVQKIASNALPRASATDCFLSLSRSITGLITISLYFAKFRSKPLARASILLAATMTQLILASAILPAKSLQRFDSSGWSLILGVLLNKAASSSRASFRSFHLEEESAAWKPEGMEPVISSSSANFLGSNSIASLYLK